MHSSLSKRLLGSLALVSFVWADYYIDDQNLTSLLYAENPAGAKWGPFQENGETLFMRLANGTQMTIDASHCFNHTFTYAACTISDSCQVQIPFTGSGITIYVLQAGPQGINASFKIDGRALNYNVLPAPSSPYFYTPNVTLFSVQGLATGNHTAIMTVQNWEDTHSGMMFDYALINQTVVVTETTSSVPSSTAVSTSPKATATSAATPSPLKPTTNVGAMAGVALGALMGLITLLLVFFYFRRRRHQPQRLSVNLDADIRIEPFSSDSLYYPWPERDSDVTEHPITESLQTRNIDSHAPACTEDSSLSVTSPKQADPYKTTPGPSNMCHSRIQQTYPTLTDDQVDFVNKLYENNVPTAAIVRVMERMMAGERQPSVDGFDSLPPPSYYYAQ